MRRLTRASNVLLGAYAAALPSASREEARRDRVWVTSTSPVIPLSRLAQPSDVIDDSESVSEPETEMGYLAVRMQEATVIMRLLGVASAIES